MNAAEKTRQQANGIAVLIVEDAIDKAVAKGKGSTFVHCFFDDSTRRYVATHFASQGYTVTTDTGSVEVHW